MEWTPILVAAIPAALVFAGVLVTQMGKRDERRAEREQSLEDRMDKLEQKLDRVQSYLRTEQQFSHRLVLVLQGVLRYLYDAARYRERHAYTLPERPPDLPDVTEIEKLLQDRPTYDDQDAT